LTNGPALAAALLICAGGAALEGLAAGRNPRAYLSTLVLPRGSPSFGGWIAIGIGYYAICATLLYRVLAGGLDSGAARAALTLLILLMTTNAFWNYLFFRGRNPRAGYLVFFPYAVIAISLVMVLLLTDQVGARIFLPYLGYMVYALWWGRRVWQLNRDPH
jgi:tryptophan-rich sensory protein